MTHHILFFQYLEPEKKETPFVQTSAALLCGWDDLSAVYCLDCDVLSPSVWPLVLILFCFVPSVWRDETRGRKTFAALHPKQFRNVKKWFQKTFFFKLLVLKVLWLRVFFFFLYWITPDSSGCSLWNMSNQVSLQHQDDVQVFLHVHFPWYNFNLKSQINVLIPKEVRRTQHNGWRDVHWIVSSLPWFARDAVTKQKNMVRFRAQRKLGRQRGAKTGSCTIFPGHYPPWTAE